jgi:hypothetical protein
MNGSWLDILSRNSLDRSNIIALELGIVKGFLEFLFITA